MSRKIGFLLTVVALLAVTPAAQAQIFRVPLSGANEIPIVVTPGTGLAIITLNPTTHEMRVRVVFSGLTGTTSASHVHCCAAQPANVGVATTTPTFAGTPLGVTSGSWDRVYDMTQASTWQAGFMAANGGTPAGAEAAFRAGVLAGQSYFNLHSSTFTGGEIRGFLVVNQFSVIAGGKGVGAALDSLGAGTGVLNDTLVTLAAMTPEQQAAAIDKLTPSSSRGTLVAVSESVSTGFDQMSNRLDGLRLADGSDVLPSGLGTLPDAAANGFWISGNGVHSRQRSREGFAGYRNGGWGLTGGFDRRVAPGLFLGGAVRYSESSLTYRNQSAGDHADIESTQVSVYGTKNVGRVFIDGMFAYGWQEYENTRDTGVAGVATGAFDGRTWGFRIGGGVPLALGDRASFTPQARFDWGSVRQDAYKETGGPLALSVASTSADSLRGSLGGQIDFAATVGDFKARPYFRGFLHRNFSDDGLDSSATFVSGGTSFFTPGQTLDRNPYTLGGGINFYTDGAFTAALAYDGNFGRSYQSHTYQAKLRWTF